jgi:hypothetical protein
MSARDIGKKCLSHKLAALHRSITAHWEDLDEQLRERIRDNFYVVEEESSPRLSLLPPPEDINGNTMPRLPSHSDLSALPHAMESVNFVIHFALRNPPGGRGYGADGVRNRGIIVTYLDALERLYSVMTAPPWNRPVPVVGAGGKTHVYVLNSHPFVADSVDGVPYIVLASRSNETTSEAEMDHAAVSATHEATHLFNYSERPFTDFHSQAWEWFDEGLAVVMETMIFPDNRDYTRLMTDWIDVPEMPLNHPTAKYHAGMFLSYLSKSLGMSFLNDVWTASLRSERPLEAMTRLTPAGLELFSADPNVRDIFASGYCMDPFFIWNARGGGSLPVVLDRYGERAIAESLTLRAGQRQQTESTLDHLACRYYRVYLNGGTTDLRLQLMVEDPDHTSLKAETVIVHQGRHRSGVVPLQPAPATAAGDAPCLTATIPRLNPSVIDHVLLVVSNCGTRVNPDLDGVEHDDGKQYTVVASAN